MRAEKTNLHKTQLDGVKNTGTAQKRNQNKYAPQNAVDFTEIMIEKFHCYYPYLQAIGDYRVGCCITESRIGQNENFLKEMREIADLIYSIVIRKIAVTTFQLSKRSYTAGYLCKFRGVT